MNKMDEIIIVAPRKSVFEDEQLAFQGVVRVENNPHAQTIVSNLASTFTTMRRGDAEVNNTFKQPIPYGILRRGEEIFVYKRLSGGGEARLHSKTSIGVGGHMNHIPVVDTFEDMIISNLNRELNEELYIGTDKIDLKIIALINDDLDEVGEVHIGLLSIIDVPINTEIKVRETDQLEGYFLTVDQLKEPINYETLESWSKIALDIL